VTRIACHLYCPSNYLPMATIRARKQADGTTRYTAIVRLRKGKGVLHQETRTFAHRAAALTWAKHREVALEDPAALVQVKQGATTVAELIRWYIEAFLPISKWRCSKQAHLKFLERCSLGKLDACDLSAALLIDHVRSRRAKGTGPAAKPARNFASPGRPASALGDPRRMSSRACATTSRAATSVRRSPCSASWNLRSHRPVGRPRSAASSGRTTMWPPRPAWCAMPSIQRPRKVTIGASSIRRAPGR